MNYFRYYLYKHMVCVRERIKDTHKTLCLMGKTDNNHFWGLYILISVPIVRTFNTSK